MYTGLSRYPCNEVVETSHWRCMVNQVEVAIMSSLLSALIPCTAMKIFRTSISTKHHRKFCYIVSCPSVHDTKSGVTSKSQR